MSAWSLSKEFSFAAFAADPDASARCLRLQAVLAVRLAVAATPTDVLFEAAEQLKAMGHDLWSWELGEFWCWDYITARPGAGMSLHFQVEDDDGAPIAPQIIVAFEANPRR